MLSRSWPRWRTTMRHAIHINCPAGGGLNPPLAQAYNPLTAVDRPGFSAGARRRHGVGLTESIQRVSCSHRRRTLHERARGALDIQIKKEYLAAGLPRERTPAVLSDIFLAFEGQVPENEQRWRRHGAQAAFLMVGQRGTGPDRRPLVRPDGRPQGCGALASVPSAGSSAGKARCTPQGISLPTASARSQGRRWSKTMGRANRGCV